MAPIAELLGREGFLRTLFEAIPCGVLIVNGDRRIRAVNHVLERTFGVSRATVLDKRGGEALKCIHSSESPEGCGHGEACHSCQVKEAALEAITGRSVYRRRAPVQLSVDGEVRENILHVSAAPVEVEGETLAIVLLEDVTELTVYKRRYRLEQSFSGIIGRDPKIQDLYDTIRDLAGSRVPVQIEGESGTGKELVAAAIHNEGPRSQGRFVPVNCGALPDNLLESELFGHVKGAFTGAFRDKKGRFQLADGGTIFLDEVGDLSPAMQVKLLRVLQEGTFEPVGGEKTLRVDVRVISATNKKLKEEVAAGRFREDLFYRICVVPITMPPLRERPGDIPLLAEYFLEKAAAESGREKAVLSPEAMATMMRCRWSGNVRELQNSLQFALIKSKGQPIEPRHMPPEVGMASMPPVAGKRRRRKLEAGPVADALRDAGGNKVKAAQLLGVSRATLYRFFADQEDEGRLP